MSIGTSDYMARLIKRRADGGRQFKGIGFYEGKESTALPMPAPFGADYFRNYAVVYKGGWEKNPPMKHEDQKLVAKFLNKNYEAPKLTPRLVYINKRVQDSVKKYDHFKMNYTGWNE